MVLGTVLALAAWVFFSAWPQLAGLAVGVVLIDLGIQSALVGNQHRIFALRPAARARLNTILVGTMFLGGAFGSAAATLAWTWGGWAAVCATGLALCVAALALTLLAGRAASARA